MNIVYFGNGPRGLKCLEEIIKAGKNIVGAVGHYNCQSEIVEYAESKGIKIFQPEKVNNPNFIKELKELKPDLFILSGYNKILKKEIINVPKLGCINLHGGKLPDYRGTAPINWQIINGEKEGGCCIVYVDEGIDTGDIIKQEYYLIDINETATDIVEKQLKLFPKMLLSAIDDIEKNQVKSISQDPNEGCYYTRRYPGDGLIDWEKMTAFNIYNLVRALSDPYPNAFTFYNDKKVRIRKTKLMERKIKGMPGRIPFKQKEGVVAIAKDYGLLITEIAIEDDKKTYNPKDMFKIGDNFKINNKF